MNVRSRQRKESTRVRAITGGLKVPPVGALTELENRGGGEVFGEGVWRLIEV